MISSPLDLSEPVWNIHFKTEVFDGQTMIPLYFI